MKYTINKDKKNLNKNVEVKMFKFNKLKNLLLTLILFSFISGKAITQEEKISNMLIALQNLANNIETVTKEFEKVTEKELNNAIIRGTALKGRGLLVIRELPEIKAALSNHFDDATIFGEILEHCSSIILEKSPKEQNTINTINNVVNKNFELNKKTNESKTPHLNEIKKAAIIQRIFEASKKDTEKLKEFLNYIVNNIFAQASISQKSLLDIIKEIDVLF
jgi:hypothetical protein